MGKVVLVCGNCGGTRTFEGDGVSVDKPGKAGKNDFQCPFCTSKIPMKFLHKEQS